MHLQLHQVGKRYRGQFWGLAEFSLELGPGVLGLLGPNGAGKSTLMRILATITKASRGTVTWNGQDIARHPDALRPVLGYLPQEFGVYPHLTALEFLSYMAAIKGLDRSTAHKRIEELLRVLNLFDARNRRLGGYSGGMKQRIGIAQALLNDPQLLIVDEPTVGLDPQERVRFRNLLSELAGERIVLLSTHIVSDVEATATDLVIINKGKLVTHSRPEQLLRSVEGKVWEWVIPSEHLRIVRERYTISNTLRRTDGVQVRLLSHDTPGQGAVAAAPTLEDAYLSWITLHTPPELEAVPQERQRMESNQ